VFTNADDTVYEWDDLSGNGNNLSAVVAPLLATSAAGDPATSGWQLQSNSVGLTATSAWFNVASSTTTNQVTITPDSTRANVFYRLLYQP